MMLGSHFISDEILSVTFSRKKPFDKAETYRLIEQAQSGDAHAKDALVEHNMGMVFQAASKYADNSFPLEDCVQEGVIGLIHAIERFDTSRGYALSTYAYMYIRAYILRAYRNKSRIIRKPVAAWSDPERKDNGPLATTAYREDLDDLPAEIDDDYWTVETLDMLEDAMSCLTPLEEAVVVRHYGLRGHTPKRLTDVAKSLGKARQSVSVAHTKALKRLREHAPHMQHALYVQ